MTMHDPYKPDNAPMPKPLQAGYLSRRMEARKPYLVVLAVVVTFVCFASLLWYSYPREAQQHDLVTVPIIRAENAPYKTVPDDPGGMYIPHRESRVFDVLAPETKSKEISSLQEEMETPVDKEHYVSEGDVAAVEEPKDLAAEQAVDRLENLLGEGATRDTSGLTVGMADIDVEDAVRKSKEPVVHEIEVPDTTQEPPLEDTRSDNVLLAPMPQKKPKNAVQSEKKDVVNAVLANLREEGQTESEGGGAVSGDYKLQLGSLKSEAAARTEWNRLKKKYQAVLGGLNLYIQPVNLGERGMFYRVQAGMLTEATAQSSCAKIQGDNPGGCIVVGP